MTTGGDRSATLRQDAQRNRRRLLEAAKEVFAEQGLDASLVDIARRAGVGDATLYRRFPTRADLYAALYAEAQEAIKQLGEQALLIEDGWTALTSYFQNACEFASANRAVGELMVVVGSDPDERETHWEHSERVMSELLGRARRQGSIHPAATPGDLFTALSALMVLIPAAAGVAPEAWRRQLAFTLNGLRPNESLLLPDTPPITGQQHSEIVNRLFLRRS